MKKALLQCFALLFACALSAQCTFETIPSAGFSISGVDSEDATNVSENAIDGDPNTHWRTNGNAPFPHQIIIDLGGVYPVSQLQVLPEQSTQNGKLFDFEVYVSMDGNDWGAVQAQGALPYTEAADIGEKTINFGAVDARFVRLAGFSNQDAGNNIHRLMIAEITVLQDPCGATGQSNQHINFSPIKKTLTTEAPFQLWATASSGLPLSYEVISGTATINGDMLTPGDQEGPVVVRAIQEGNTDYYPTEAFRVFNLIDPANYSPILTTRLTDAYPIFAEQLNAYPLYAAASIEHNDLLSISGIDFIIDGNSFSATYDDGAYVYWWLPPAYGDFDVKIIAHASNGKTVERDITLTVETPQSSISLITLQDDLIDFNSASRSVSKTFQLPQFVGSYDVLFADFWVECPNVPGGCDDWDRLAYIQVKAPNGEWIEFVRYITPYGVGCSHFVDLSNYLSLLQGEVEIRMFIDTWGTGGWNVNLQLNYERGTPKYLYTDVDVLWEGSFPFGNFNTPQPLDTIAYTFPEDTEEAEILLTTTGHGWGDNNSLNAAEFFHATHHIKVDETTSFEQDLWMDCDPNPDACTGQMGSWTFNRAGWCPGAIGKMYNYDLSDFIAQNTVDLSYIFQEDYRDLCNTSNPDCVSGVTCDNCSDGFNPNYRVRGHMITRRNAKNTSSTQDRPNANNSYTIFPNPSTGSFHLKHSGTKEAGSLTVTIQSVDGKLLRSFAFDQVAALAGHAFDLSDLGNGSYWVKVTTEESVEVMKWIKN